MNNIDTKTKEKKSQRVQTEKISLKKMYFVSH